MPSSSTLPASGAVSPSQISMVVVFPGAIRPQQPEALASGYFKVQAVDRHHVAIGLSHPAQQQRRAAGILLPVSETPLL